MTASSATTSPPHAAPETSHPAPTVHFDQRGDAAVLIIDGRLDADALPAVWTQSLTGLKTLNPKRLIIDGAKLTYCDGAGLGLFAELRRRLAATGGKVTFQHLQPTLNRLVMMSLLQDPSATELKPRPRIGAVTYVGEKALSVLSDQRRLLVFIGQLSCAMIWAICNPREVRYRDFIRVAQKAGADALPVVSLLGGLVGVILSFQMAAPLRSYGAEHLIPTIVSYAIIRELGPLITAILLAGRSGAAFAAEIGTMKVTEELSALRTLGLEPIRFLVVPRVMAAVAMTPVLAAYNILCGLVGSCAIVVSLGYPFRFFIDSVREGIEMKDFIGGLVKSAVFGLIVAGVGCLRGTQTGSGPGAVGDSTTRAVVAGIVLTIVADAALGVTFYYLGI